MPNFNLGQVAAHPVEGILQIRLIEAVHLRPAAAAELGKVELHQPLADAVLEPIPLRRYEVRQESVSDTKGGESTHRLIVEDAGPRKAVQTRVLLQHYDAVAAPPQQRSDNHADRPVPHHGDDGIHLSDVLVDTRKAMQETVLSTISKVNA